MKSKLLLLVSALGLCAVSPVWAAPITFDFGACGSIVSTYGGQCPGNLAVQTATFVDSTNTYAIQAIGTDYSLNGLDLYVKNGGSTETGLGINGGAQDEINYGQAIFLDMSNLTASGIDSGTVSLSSLQSGESGQVCDVTSALVFSNCQVVTELGSSQIGSAAVTWSMSNSYLVFYTPPEGSGNFLIDSLTAVAAPEPGSAALFLAGLMGLGFMVARRRSAPRH